ncbi:MAG: hypothetical protein ACRCTP_08055 [Aeromonas popoffii]|uniref:hypothetical protein n=1 Tax=Aeromonas popoffii TaxID=70856 RepID=UPI003F355791
MKVRDVLYEFKEGFLPVQFVFDAMEEAKEEYNRKEIMNNYETFKNAIPKDWIKKIESEEPGNKEKDVYAMVGGKLCVFKECTVKMFYAIFRDVVFKKPKANDYWMQRHEDLKEDNIWSNTKGKLVETKLANSEFLIRHRAIFTDAILHKIGREQSAVCKVCGDEDEGFLHLFLHCRELDSFKTKCKELFEKLKGGRFEKESDWNKTVMLGENYKCKNGKVINLLVMIMKSAIWERRVVAKREKTVTNVETIFKRKAEKYLTCLYCYFKTLDKLDDFYRVFTDKVCKILEDFNWEMPDDHG